MSDLESIYDALVQAQDCIRDEPPEGMTYQEAREDTINKVRDAMRTIEALKLRAPAQTPFIATAVTGIRAAEIVADYLNMRLPDLDKGDAANIIHILHEEGVRFAPPAQEFGEDH